MFGVSFAPTGTQGANGDPTQRPLADPNGTNVSPLQTAIRTLSLRLPNALGPQPIAPGLLLNGAGGTGFHGGTPGSGFNLPGLGMGQHAAPFDLVSMFPQLFGQIGGGTVGGNGAPQAGSAPWLGFGGGTQAPVAAPPAFGNTPPVAPPQMLNPATPDQQHQGFQNFMGGFHQQNQNAPMFGGVR